MNKCKTPISFTYGILEGFEEHPCLLVSTSEYLEKMKENEALTLDTLQLSVAMWFKARLNFYNPALNYFEERREMISHVMNMWADAYTGMFAFALKEDSGLVWIELMFTHGDGTYSSIITGAVDTIIQTPFSTAKSVSLKLGIKMPVT